MQYHQCLWNRRNWGSMDKNCACSLVQSYTNSTCYTDILFHTPSISLAVKVPMETPNRKMNWGPQIRWLCGILKAIISQIHVLMGLLLKKRNNYLTSNNTSPPHSIVEVSKKSRVDLSFCKYAPRGPLAI